MLKNAGHCYILDCHSFHDDMKYTGYNVDEFPDVCLGFNDVVPSDEIVWIKELFEKNGYTVEYNVPFAGSLVPLKYMGDDRVKSVMIELNRRIYYNDDNDFKNIQSLCKMVYDYLDNCAFECSI